MSEQYCQQLCTKSFLHAVVVTAAVAMIVPHTTGGSLLTSLFAFMSLPYEVT